MLSNLGLSLGEDDMLSPLKCTPVQPKYGPEDDSDLIHYKCHLTRLRRSGRISHLIRVHSFD